MNLVEAIRPRVQLMAASIAYRLNQQGRAGSWDTYHVGEPLVGVLYKEDAIRFHRPPVFSGTEQAVIYIENIKPTDLKNQEFGPDVVIEGNIQERFHEHLEVAEGVTYEDTVSHTFSTTTTREDSYKQGLRILAVSYTHLTLPTIYSV